VPSNVLHRPAVSEIASRARSSRSSVRACGRSGELHRCAISGLCSSLKGLESCRPRPDIFGGAMVPREGARDCCLVAQVFVSNLAGVRAAIAELRASGGLYGGRGLVR
jgi:hypothetical protein